MRPKTRGVIAAAVILIVSLAYWGLFQEGASFQPAPDLQDTATINHQDTSPIAGKVTMIDLGAEECVPCKMMAPILKELKQAYAGRAEILFIDVWENREQARKYGIRAIPTQIFFNEKGEEVYRHTGFMNRETIVGHLSKLGVSPPEAQPDP